MVKIGIIGSGKICQGPHMGAYDKIDNAQIVAICDIDEKKLESVSKRYPNAKLYTDYKEMIANEELDAVDICTPNNIHSQAAVYALDNGLNVICEKPDAINVAEAEKMKLAAEKSGKTLMVIRNNRYRPTTKFLKEYIKEGKMGEIYAGRCGWIRRRGIPGWVAGLPIRHNPVVDHLSTLAFILSTLLCILWAIQSLLPLVAQLILSSHTPHTRKQMLRTLQWASSVLITALACKLNSLGHQILNVIKCSLSFVEKRQALVCLVLIENLIFSPRNVAQM